MKNLILNLLYTPILFAFVACGISSNKNDNDKPNSHNQEILSETSVAMDNQTKDSGTKAVIYPEIKLSDPKWKVQQYIGRRLLGNYDTKDVKDCKGDININVCIGYFTDNINLNNLDAVNNEMIKEYPQAKKLDEITKIGKYDAIAYSCVGFLKKPDESEINNKNHFVGFFIPDVEDYDNEGKPVLMKIDIEYDYYVDPEYWKETEAMTIIQKAFTEACESLTFVETDL